jgi:hypothetical protein
VVTVKGSDLLTALRQPGMAIAGAEVASPSPASATEFRIGGAPLDPDRSYRVAAEDFHAANTPGLKGKPAQTGGDVRDLVVQWLRTTPDRQAISSQQSPHALR